MGSPLLAFYYPPPRPFSGGRGGSKSMNVLTLIKFKASLCVKVFNSCNRKVLPNVQFMFNQIVAIEF
jgi:hypothetical protein